MLTHLLEGAFFVFADDFYMFVYANNLGAWKVGSLVNLERCMKFSIKTARTKCIFLLAIYKRNAPQTTLCNALLQHTDYHLLPSYHIGISNRFNIHRKRKQFFYKMVISYFV